jgi:hypothetical protein
MTNQSDNKKQPQKTNKSGLDCHGSMHPRVAAGLDLFNRGMYFEAHEELEAAWRAERGPIRELYLAILQIGLGYLQIQRKNYQGAVKMFRRCKRWLEPFPSKCVGINLARLRKDYAIVEAVLLRFGPEGISQFPLKLIKPISYKVSKSETTKPESVILEK